MSLPGMKGFPKAARRQRGTPRTLSRRHLSARGTWTRHEGKRTGAHAVSIIDAVDVEEKITRGIDRVAEHGVLPQIEKPLESPQPLLVCCAVAIQTHAGFIQAAVLLRSKTLQGSVVWVFLNLRKVPPKWSVRGKHPQP